MCENFIWFVASNDTKFGFGNWLFRSADLLTSAAKSILQSQFQSDFIRKNVVSLWKKNEP